MVLIARRRSGKTGLTKTFCERFRPYFPNVALFTKSVADCEYEGQIPWSCTVKGLRDPRSQAALRALIENQKRKTEENKELARRGLPLKNIRLLIIIDDCVSEGMRWCPELVEIFVEGRHFNVSCIVTMQYINAIPPDLKENADLVILFASGAANLYELVWSYWLGTAGKQLLGRVLSNCMDYEHQFCCIANYHPNIPWYQRLSTGIVEIPEELFPMGNQQNWCKEYKDMLALTYLDMLDFFESDQFCLEPTMFFPMLIKPVETDGKDLILRVKAKPAVSLAKKLRVELCEEEDIEEY